MTMAVASSDAMRSLIARMASATDDALVDIAKQVSAAAWSVVDAITVNPIAGLFDPKTPEVVQQQQNLREAIAAVSDSTIKGRQSLIDALTYLQATIETTNAFYSDNEAWSGAINQFGADLAKVTQDIVDNAVKPAVALIAKGVWHRFRWPIIGISVVLAIVVVLVMRKEVAFG